MNINDINLTSIADEEFSVIDFETTGISAIRDRAIEIGIVKIRNLEIVDKYTSLIFPECQIPYRITAITSITNFDVKTAPTFGEIANEIKEFIGNSILIAHNMSFDFSFLKNEFLRYGYSIPNNQVLCTLKLARRVYPEIESKSLGRLTKALKIKLHNAHRALGDATATAELFFNIVKKLKNDFEINSIKDLLDFQKRPINRTLSKVKKKPIASKISEFPNASGVYFFTDKNEKIIYIGKAKSLKRRINNYFANNATSKAKKIVSASANVNFIKTPSELSALIKEAELIKRHKPKFNRLLKKYGKTFFIKISRTEDFPYPIITNEFSLDRNDYFGPYNNRETAETIIDIIEKAFQLRECSDKEFNRKHECYLTEIERCVAPCINNNKKIYENELLNVYDFLKGKNQNAVNRLLERMKKFSVQQKYEEAAILRDTLQNVLQQLNKASIINEPINSGNMIIKINSSENVSEYVFLLSGKIILQEKETFSDEDFRELLESNYYGNINSYPQLKKIDLERIKITLSWLLKNKLNVKIFYLKNYSCYKDLLLDLNK